MVPVEARAIARRQADKNSAPCVGRFSVYLMMLVVVVTNSGLPTGAIANRRAGFVSSRKQLLPLLAVAVSACRRALVKSHCRR